MSITWDWDDDESEDDEPTCPNCYGERTWCSSCRTWSQNCCVDYGTCQCS